MAEQLNIKVRCHACGNQMTGTAKYGKGHYVASGMDFKFTAIGKFVDKNTKKSRVKGQVEITCPECEVNNRYEI